MTETDAAGPVALDGRAGLEELIGSRERALVMFYTNGCGKCAAMEPRLGLAARETEATIATINARETLDLVEELDLRGVPTLVRYLDGEPVDQRFGVLDTAELVEFAEE